jgi:WD40 repeat protein
MVFSPDGERVATSLGDGSVKIWDTKTGDELLDLLGHTTPVTGVDFSPDGRYLATSSPDGTVRKWDASSGQELVVYRSPGSPLFDVKITTDGKRIIVSGAGYIYGYVFDLDETIRLTRSRLTRWFTQEECRKYLHEEECPPTP